MAVSLELSFYIYFIFAIYFIYLSIFLSIFSLPRDRTDPEFGGAYSQSRLLTGRIFVAVEFSIN